MAEEFFLRGDTPHSLAKRDLLKGTIASVIARRLHSLDVFSDDRYAMTYLDAFAGRGSFGRQDYSQVVSFDYDQVTMWGTPIIAIGVTLDHMNNLMARESTQATFESFELNRLNTVLFIFNDSSQDNIKKLSEKIDEGFQQLNWEKWYSPCSISGKSFPAFEYKGPFLSKSQSIRICFTNYKFHEMSFLVGLQSPLFSLIDPFGIAQIPMEIVSMLIGDRKEFYINFMVSTLYR
jgi:hypothetical protein